MRIKPLLIASAALAIALPAIAQQVRADAARARTSPARIGRSLQTRATSTSEAPRFATAGPTKARSRKSRQPQPRSRRRRRSNIRAGRGAIRGSVGSARPGRARDSATMPWGDASGAFLSTLMRRMDTPIASRWAHIALRDALLAKVARAARRQSGRLGRRARLAAAAAWAKRTRRGCWSPGSIPTASRPRWCRSPCRARSPTPTRRRCARSKTASANTTPAIRQLVQAMCASLAGEPEAASAQIDDARRYGRIGGIDLALAAEGRRCRRQAAARRRSNGIRSIA